MKLLNFKIGPIETNCYIIINKYTNEAIIIDPADESEKIINAISENKITPKVILLTHTHFDHIGAVDDLVKKYSIPFYFSESEVQHYQMQKQNLAAFGYNAELNKNYQFIKESIYDFCNFKIKVIATPGHTIGSVCYYIESNNILFSGDTLFYRTIGRTDLPTGSHKQLINSIENILFNLPDETIVYPGHENQTTIGDEKKFNPLV
jgi:hydroxyacylglutathione hydrolase